jgi:hypothetical protein
VTINSSLTRYLTAYKEGRLPAPSDTMDLEGYESGAAAVADSYRRDYEALSRADDDPSVDLAPSIKGLYIGLDGEKNNEHKVTAVIDASADPVTGEATQTGQKNLLENWDLEGQDFRLHALSLNGDRLTSVRISQASSSSGVTVIEEDLGMDGSNSHQTTWYLTPDRV